MSKTKLRSLWFSVHKWIGLLLAILIIPISLSGAILVYHDWLDVKLHSARYETSGPATLPPSRYAEAAQAVLGPDHRIASLRYPEEERGAVVVTAVPSTPPKGQPQRTNVYLDGGDARVIEKSGFNDSPLRFLHVLHGSLMVPGVGRQVVGWIGVAMLVSSLTGLWLWWPLSGSLGRGLRWNRRPQFDTNLHHQLGFWVSVPLAMLSFTGAWISFPAFFGPIAGERAPQRPAPSVPLASPVLDVNAIALKAGTQPVSITWPTEKSAVWKVGLEKGEAEIVDATGAVTRKPPRPKTIAQTMRRWHDGVGMGPLWQLVIFLGGIIPVVLAITGITMWVNSRKWRRRPERRLSPAE